MFHPRFLASEVESTYVGFCECSVRFLSVAPKTNQMASKAPLGPPSRMTKIVFFFELPGYDNIMIYTIILDLSAIEKS